MKTNGQQPYKTLILVRHAKSDWGNLNLSDFDRPLNERGLRDAPRMARHLVEKGIVIDAFIASPAKRAKKTAQIFAEAYKREKDSIIYHTALYLAPPTVFFDVISNTNDQYNHIAVFSHNNGLTDFANLLTSTRIDELPTCGVFAVSVATDSWANFTHADKHFLFCDYPKGI